MLPINAALGRRILRLLTDSGKSDDGPAGPAASVRAPQHTDLLSPLPEELRHQIIVWLQPEPDCPRLWTVNRSFYGALAPQRVGLHLIARARALHRSIHAQRLADFSAQVSRLPELHETLRAIALRAMAANIPLLDPQDQFEAYRRLLAHVAYVNACSRYDAVLDCGVDLLDVQERRADALGLLLDTALTNLPEQDLGAACIAVIEALPQLPSSARLACLTACKRRIAGLRAQLRSDQWAGLLRAMLEQAVLLPPGAARAGILHELVILCHDLPRDDKAALLNAFATLATRRQDHWDTSAARVLIDESLALPPRHRAQLLALLGDQLDRIPARARAPAVKQLLQAAAGLPPGSAEIKAALIWPARLLCTSLTGAALVENFKNLLRAARALPPDQTWDLLLKLGESLLSIADIGKALSIYRDLLRVVEHAWDEPKLCRDAMTLLAVAAPCLAGHPGFSPAHEGLVEHLRFAPEDRVLLLCAALRNMESREAFDYALARTRELHPHETERLVRAMDISTADDDDRGDWTAETAYALCLRAVIQTDSRSLTAVRVLGAFAAGMPQSLRGSALRTACDRLIDGAFVLGPENAHRILCAFVQQPKLQAPEVTEMAIRTFFEAVDVAPVRTLPGVLAAVVASLGVLAPQAAQTAGRLVLRTLKTCPPSDSARLLIAVSRQVASLRATTASRRLTRHAIDQIAALDDDDQERVLRRFLALRPTDTEIEMALQKRLHGVIDAITDRGAREALLLGLADRLLPVFRGHAIWPHFANLLTETVGMPAKATDALAQRLAAGMEDVPRPSRIDACRIMEHGQPLLPLACRPLALRVRVHALAWLPDDPDRDDIVRRVLNEVTAMPAGEARTALLELLARTLGDAPEERTLSRHVRFLVESLLAGHGARVMPDALVISSGLFKACPMPDQAERFDILLHACLRLPASSRWIGLLLLALCLPHLQGARLRSRALAQCRDAADAMPDAAKQRLIGVVRDHTRRAGDAPVEKTLEGLLAARRRT